MSYGRRLLIHRTDPGKAMLRFQGNKMYRSKTKPSDRTRSLVLLISLLNGVGLAAIYRASTYKIPDTGDISEHFKISLLHEPNREGKLLGRGKAVAEPPLMMAISVFEKLRAASAADSRTSVKMDAPTIAENVLRALRTPS